MILKISIIWTLLATARAGVPTEHPAPSDEINVENVSIFNYDDTDTKMTYFVGGVDTDRRNYTEAADFCKSADKDAELAIMTGKPLFVRIKTNSNWPPIGQYWINGKEDPTTRTFVPKSDCASSERKFDLLGVDVEGENCLVLVKGVSPEHTYLTAKPCSEKLRTLCSLTYEDCA